MRLRRKVKIISAKVVALGLLAGLQMFAGSVSALANDHVRPWKQKHRAIVIDAYEKNEIDWLTLAENKRVRAFINKASDGLPSPWKCRKKGIEQVLCKKTFQNFFMKQQIYHTRKVLAKSLGMKWGAYHLGRPGNPIDQANNFIDFADPQEDELIALDIEDNDPKKWISFEDAEIFAKHIYHRLGRYPVLYTNHSTAKAIALRSEEFPILSRMQLWYARFKDRIPGVFPMGNWDNYAMWQFSAGTNCNKRRCLHRIAGTPHNIDVNITTLSIEEFDKAWPFNELVPSKNLMMVFDDLLYVEDPRMIYDAQMLLANAPVQGNRGYLPPEKAEPDNQEMLMVEYHRPMDDVYAIDEMAVASIVKSQVTHPLHQNYSAPQVVEDAELTHPLHQTYSTRQVVKVTSVTHPLHQMLEPVQVVEVTELTHPFHQNYPVLREVDTVEVTHPLHQMPEPIQVVEVAELTHPLHQNYSAPKAFEVASVTHPLHQMPEPVQVVEVAELTHPIHQDYSVSREVDTVEVTHPLHQMSEPVQVVKVASVTHPLHQMSEPVQVVEVAELTHPFHQNYPVLREVDTAQVTHPIHQQRQASLAIEATQAVQTHHHELVTALGIDDNIITGSIEQPRRIRHPLYYR